MSGVTAAINPGNSGDIIISKGDGHGQGDEHS